MEFPTTPEIEGALETVLQSSGNVEVFLDNFFSFLARRTDFFIECPPEGGRYGFVKGHAENMVRSKFKKWQEFHQLSRRENDSQPKFSKLEASSSSSKAQISPTTTATTKTIKQNDNQKAVSASENDSHNGKVTDKYSWSQSIQEVDVTVPVSKEIIKGKQVKVTIETNRLVVNLVGDPEPIIDGKLSFSAKKDDSYWNLVPGEAIRIWLQKSQERWWQALVEGEDLLDMSKIEAVRPMEDLDEEEQMKLQELCWNEDRKRQGLPTSEELKIQNTLRNAWNLEGSPFKGQPFDASMVQLGNQGTFPIPSADLDPTQPQE